MSKNIEMNYFNGSTYEKMVPSTVAGDNSCFLTAETAALLGLGSDAVPDDAFGILSNNYKYCWRKRTNNSFYEPVVADTNNVVIDGLSSNTTYKSVVYGDGLSISSDGHNIVINNQTSGAIDYYNRPDSANILKGKYYQISGDTTQAFFLPSNASLSNKYINDSNFQIISDVEVTRYVPTYRNLTGEWQFVFSTDRNAYPDSGIVGELEYEYCGIPFDNAVTAPKIATGSYTGTGTYGASNPNSLTFEFVPKVVIVQQQDSAIYGGFPWQYGTYVAKPYISSGTGVVSLSWERNTVSWYNETNQTNQLNVSNVTYNYVAIG